MTMMTEGMSKIARSTRWQAFLVVMLFLSRQAVWALPDHLTVTANNPNTSQQVTLELDRYSLRATNWQCRVYTSPTSYTVLASNQVPEVTTYRGRTSDGGMVWGSVRPNGSMFTRVNYGCRWAGAGNSDPYENSSRYAWTGNIQLPYPVITNSYVYTPAANQLVPAAAPPAGWYNNLGATTNFGGPKPFNNLWKMPVGVCRLVCSVNQSSLAGTYANNMAWAIAASESAVNESDVFSARDAGIAFRIEAEGFQLYPDTGGVDTSANWSDLSGKFDIMCWVANWGVSGGTFVIDYPSDMGASTWVHELGHSLGGPDFPHELDYQGGLWDTCHVLNAPEMNSLDLGGAIGGRSRGNYLTGGGWGYYRSPLPTRANPDFASTTVSTPVDVDVLLNDWNVNTTNRADLVIDSVQNPSDHGGTVTHLGNGVIRYTPAAGFRGDDLFRYYVKDVSGNFKTLAGVRILVADPANPLIGHYTFNETTGTNLFDSSGASGGNRSARIVRGSFDTMHTAGVGSTTNTGALHLSGLAGGAHVSFGMAVDSAGTPDPKAGYLYDAMDRSQSVSLWYKPDAKPPGGERHYLYLKDAALYGETAGFIMGIDNTNFFAQVQMYGRNEYNPALVVASVGPNVPGMWYHLVGEIDRENGQVHLYVNGVKYSSAAGALSAGDFVVGPCFANLGAQNIWGYQGWRPAPAGALDDLRIYSKALSATEVTNLYNAPGVLPAILFSPADGQSNVVLLPLLSWAQGRPGYLQDLYFGTNAVQVAAADTSTPGLYLGRSNHVSLQLTNLLAASTTYYWRVDEVDGTTVGKGAVWQFTTGLPSSACDMLSFSWGGRTAAISGTNVTLVAPYGAPLASLNPSCTVSPYATVTPTSDTTNNFSTPVNYTVTAQDGTSRKVYRVMAIEGANPTPVQNGGFEIPATRTPFYNNSLASGQVSNWVQLSGSEPQLRQSVGSMGTGENYVETAKLPPAYVGWLPANTNGGLWAFMLQGYSGGYNGAKQDVGPIVAGSTYTASADFARNTGGDLMQYDFFLMDGTANTALAGIDEVTGGVPAYGVWTNMSFSYTATSAVNGHELWIVLRTRTNPGGVRGGIDNVYVAASTGSLGKDILSFTISNQVASAIDPDLHTVTVTMPYGTPLTVLVPTITVSPFATVSPASGGAGDFSSPVNYTVTAQDGVHSNLYGVTVSVAAPSAACELLSLNWGAYEGAIAGTNVTLTVPYGTAVTNLNPTCTISAGATVLPKSGSTNNFTSPVSYTVMAQDGLTTKTYQVTVDTVMANTNCDLTAFNVGASVGVINQTNRTVALTVPYGTIVTNLNPTCTISTGATVSPKSGSTNDFTSPVSYTVTAQDGLTTKTYQVTVVKGSANADVIVTAPLGLQVGDQYRLIFVTTHLTFGAANAGGFTTIAEYNSFGASAAAAAPALNALGTTWNAVVSCNPSASANNNTGTSGGAGVAIYNLAGLIVANNNADLWDGSIQNPINVTEQGTGPTTNAWKDCLVWTGMNPDGSVNGDRSLSYPSGGYILSGDPNATTDAWSSTLGAGDANARHWIKQAIYVMSGILTVTEANASTNCVLTAFTVGTTAGVINQTARTVVLTVPYGISVTNLNPTCTISTGATVVPASGSTNDFTSPVSYTVTAQDGLTTKTYQVTVVKEPANADVIVTVPAGLKPGAQYRLVFVTSTTIYGKAAAGSGAGPVSINDFNTFGANTAAAIPALSALGTTWKAVVSTRSADGNTYVSAKANTGTDSGTGVPFYNLGGLLVSSDYTKLWSSALVNPINVTELGKAPTKNFGSYYTVFTGTANNGGAAGGASLCYPDGGYMMSGDPTTTSITADNAAPDWISQLPGDPNNYQWNKMPIYVMSGILEVQPSKGTVILLR